MAERTADFGEFIAAHPDEVHPVVRDIILGGERFSAVELFNAQHRLAELTRAIAPVWNAHRFYAGADDRHRLQHRGGPGGPVTRNTNLGYYTNFTNLLDMAGIAIPSGFNAKGFPAGVTLIGPAWSDARLR